MAGGTGGVLEKLRQSPAISRAWATAERLRVRALPDRVRSDGGGTMHDGFSHFIEVRRGAEYHASSMGDLSRPRTGEERRAVAIIDAILGLR